MPPRNRLQPAVVLVADRTLSADYAVLLEGMFATMQTTETPAWLMRRLPAPPVPTDDQGRAVAAPLGLRRVESALLAGTSLGRDDVACATPESIRDLLGPWTKLVAVSSGDPLGEAMSNTTTASFCRGELYTRHWTAQMMREIAAAKARYGFAVVGGGAGAWQWTRHRRTARQQGFDAIFEGNFEAAGPAFFQAVVDGRKDAADFHEPGTCVEDIQPIRGASVLGLVELSRGCGNGCRFCASADKPMAHVPADTILSDLEMNVAAGVTAAVCGSEDFFRYGAAGAEVNFETLRALLLRVREIKGLSFLQIDHANICSVLQFDDAQLIELRRLLDRGKGRIWVNLGIESAGGRLVAANCPGKIAPFRPEDWDEMARQACAKMMRTGFFPVFSVVLGLPGETPADVLATLRLVRHLDAQGAVVFPIFHEPLGADDRAFDVGRMRQDHADLVLACYEMNFRRVPALIWDNQRAAGVPRRRRIVYQVLGRGETFRWRRRLGALARQVSRRSAERPAERRDVAAEVQA